MLNQIEEHPETTARIIERQLNMNYVTVWHFEKHQQLYPYHIQGVLPLLARDLVLGVVNQNFQVQHILWTAIMTIHNKYVRFEDTFYAVIQKKHETGIVRQYVGWNHQWPLDFGNINYRYSRRRFLLWNNVACGTCVIVLHSTSVIFWLTFFRNQIEIGVSQPWSPGSLNIVPFDLFSWEHSKSLVSKM